VKKSLASSSKKDREVEEEREETTKRRRVLKEYPDISKDTRIAVISGEHGSNYRPIMAINTIEWLYLYHSI
jgi:hypothetical protein